jgi:hypothetical protein
VLALVLTLGNAYVCVNTLPLSACMHLLSTLYTQDMLIMLLLYCCYNCTYTYVHITQVLDYTEPAVQNPGPRFASTVPQGTQAGTYSNMHT